MSDRVLVSRSEGVLWLAFNRPEKKNALDRETYLTLIRALDDARRDAAVRAVVFSGTGADFTAGNDLSDFRDFMEKPEDFPALAFVRTLAAFEKPMVAAVTGDAIGVGATMLFHCDLVYASRQARLRMPFIDLGLVPEAGASLLVPLRFGMARASQYLLAGEDFSGEDAFRLGLVNALVEPEAVLETAKAAAKKLAQKPPAALLAARRLMRGDPAEILARIDEEAALFAQALASPTTRERLAAFFARGR
ncbi:enoyl-CoA hydratase-related protein [Methylocystis sp. MJC1]|jgi:enoyl-CoA hydratase/carnithine racemase|uniref:enoyl-CoA hydratase-related protein n=1 Tax=Methylocystis sp. MJC1 TaxID=2654282 RepID=UPI0013EA2D14|nr:enoyl-CoA hydratase-related protein [Methylocystis sp. MJC1]KAF2990498.1 2,3-dehydroadipyl-CoA hydratase [Methylocystis sp. MJC1]MBU6525838.1 enoyl-CoA hydratase/isomerase family protein [Methylocystis sp. MJC1]UZX12305.1 enoyl-CoA hydratase-related protein [Methylocystis sp. MJC1]